VCTFSYISKEDFAPKTPTGFERTWLDLKLEFSRTGEGLAGAKYYKTIVWHRYQTATNIQCKNVCLENEVKSKDKHRRPTFFFYYSL